MNKKIDLHLHTTMSDGEESVKTVIRKAYEEGLKVIAITDHNCFAIKEPQLYHDMQVIPGSEISANYYAPDVGNIEIHILAIFPRGMKKEYAFDKKINDKKEKYIQAVLDFLASKGMYISMDEVKKKDASQQIGRIKIAEIMVQKGYSNSVVQAMDNWIGNYSPYYINPTCYFNYPDYKEVTNKIIESGGIPILAHPFGYRLNKEQIKKLIRKYADAAVEKHQLALEVFYQDYIEFPDKIAFLKKMAKECGLLMSGSSDRHRSDQSFATGANIELYNKMLKNSIK